MKLALMTLLVLAISSVTIAGPDLSTSDPNKPSKNDSSSNRGDKGGYRNSHDKWPKKVEDQKDKQLPHHTGKESEAEPQPTTSPR